MKTYEPIKIKAIDAEDLGVLSACLQDALVPLKGMEYDKENGKFYLVANRFCWECHPEKVNEDHVHHRVQAGLHVDHVRSVKETGVNRDHPDHFMNLLTIHNPKDQCLSLVFSGGAEVQIEIDKLACHLKDLDEPHPTHLKPNHDV